MKSTLSLGIGVILGVAAGAMLTNILDLEPGDSARLAEELVLAEIGHSGVNLTVLEQLNGGDIDASRKVLEAAVATNVVVLDEWKRTLGPAHSEMITRALRRVREYSTEHPLDLGDREAQDRVSSILADVH
jgi:hypothetical protein